MLEKTDEGLFLTEDYLETIIDDYDEYHHIYVEGEDIGTAKDLLELIRDGYRVRVY